MIAGIMTNRKLHAKTEELFERCKKLNISLFFIAQPCFTFLKDVRLNFVQDGIFILYKGKQQNNKKWPYIPDRAYRIFFIDGSGSGKTSTLINLIKDQNFRDVIDKIYLHARDLNKRKYQFLIKNVKMQE